MAYCPITMMTRPSHPTSLRLALAALLAASGVVAGVSFSSFAQDRQGTRQETLPEVRQHLQSLERDLKQSQSARQNLDAKAEALERELADLRAQAMSMAERQRQQEGELSRLEADIAALGRDEHERLARIEARRDDLARLLGALQRLGRVPPDALLAAPQAPEQLIKTALLLRATTPEAKKQADALAQEAQALSTLRRRLAEERNKAERATASLAIRQKDLAAIVARRENASRGNQQEQEELQTKIAALAGKADDLKDLIERLQAAEAARKEQALQAERARRTREKAAKPPREQGDSPLMAPVNGAIVTRYGEADDVGLVSRGLTYRGRPASSIVAPAEATVKFAGPFKGYGLLLILEHANGYHSLLAGMGRIDARVGQRVLAGEPVGVLADNASPTLYFEVRRGGQPINPQRGFPASDSKG
jgi:murein hydrolase activator